MDTRQPWRLGLTGGIASGKSTVAAHFAALAVPIVDLDEIAREVVAPGTILLTRVFERFGPDVQLRDGSLNRRALRDIIFANLLERQALEGMLHPAIRALADARTGSAGGPYQIIVDPLIAEIGTARRYQRVLLVDCDETLQLARLRQRDGCSEAQAAAALGAQATRATRRAIADDILENNGNTAALAQQVNQLHVRYLNLAAAIH